MVVVHRLGKRKGESVMEGGWFAASNQTKTKENDNSVSTQYQKYMIHDVRDVKSYHFEGTIFHSKPFFFFYVHSRHFRQQQSPPFHRVSRSSVACRRRIESERQWNFWKMIASQKHLITRAISSSSSSSLLCHCHTLSFSRRRHRRHCRFRESLRFTRVNQWWITWHAVAAAVPLTPCLVRKQI